MIGTKLWLNQYSSSPPDGLLWVCRLQGEDSYSLRAEGGAWKLTRGEQKVAAVTVDAKTEACAVFLTSQREKRRLPTMDILPDGCRAEVRRFVKAFAAKPAGR